LSSVRAKGGKCHVAFVESRRSALILAAAFTACSGKFLAILSLTNPRLVRGRNYDASRKDVEGKVKSSKNDHSDNKGQKGRELEIPQGNKGRAKRQRRRHNPI